MEKLFFTTVYALLFLSVPCFSVQGENGTTTESPDKVDIHQSPNGPIRHSVDPILTLDVWSYDDCIAFVIDRNIGDMEIQIIDAAGQILKATTYNVTEGTVYLMDVSALPSGVYTLLLIVPEYLGMGYEWYFFVY